MENIIPNSIQIKPIVIDLLKKTEVTQLLWKVISIERDENSSATCRIELFNKEKTMVAETSLDIPKEVLAEWISNEVIDNFVLNELGLEKCQKEIEEETT